MAILLRYMRVLFVTFVCVGFFYLNLRRAGLDQRTLPIRMRLEALRVHGRGELEAPFLARLRVPSPFFEARTRAIPKKI